jgi:hypothetical protein
MSVVSKEYSVVSTVRSTRERDRAAYYWGCFIILDEIMIKDALQYIPNLKACCVYFLLLIEDLVVILIENIDGAQHCYYYLLLI